MAAALERKSCRPRGGPSRKLLLVGAAVDYSGSSSSSRNSNTNHVGLESLINNNSNNDGNHQIAESKIENLMDFCKWRVSVLGRYEAFVDQKGIDTARSNEEKVSQALKDLLLQTIQAVQTEIQQGGIRTDFVSVRGSKVLKELNDQASKLTIAMSELVPNTSQVESKVGYNKYQLGAVLLRNDFRIYEWIMNTNGAMKKLYEDRLEHCLTKSTRDHILLTMKGYIQQTQAFCETMAEMGLLEAMIRRCALSGQTIEPPKLIADQQKSGAPVPQESTKGDKTLSMSLAKISLMPSKSFGLEGLLLAHKATLSRGSVLADSSWILQSKKLSS